MKSTFKFLSLVVFGFALGIPSVHAKDLDLEDATIFDCASVKNPKQGVRLFLREGVLDQIVDVVTFDHDAVDPKGGAPAQVFVAYTPWQMDFKYINDGGEDIFRFDSVVGSVKSDPKVGIVSFDATLRDRDQDSGKPISLKCKRK